MRKKKFIILLFSILFIFIMMLVILNKSSFIDDNIYNFVISIRNDFFDNYFMFITRLGNTKVVLGIIIAFCIIFHNKNSIYLSLCSLGSVCLNTLIKVIIKRQRPNILRLIEQGGYSFPSGHAMISISLYGFLLYLVLSEINNKILKYCVSIILIFIIISIGASRIYLGVHFASDVIAGYLLASIYVIIFIMIIDKYKTVN